MDGAVKPPASRDVIRVLHVTAMYPTAARPSFGAFVKSQVESLRRLDGVETDLHVVPGGNGPFPYLKGAGALLRRIGGRYDIIHVHYGTLSSWIKMICRGKTPLVTSYCGSDLHGNAPGGGFASLKNGAFRALNRRLARFDAHSIVKSEELAREIRGISPAVSIVPNGVDVDLFRPFDRLESRRRLGWSERGAVILFPANTADRNKNFPLIEHAVEAAGKKRCRLVTFEGATIAHDDVPLYLNAADLVAITSRREGSPNIVKEAMACGCRIFSTPCGDVRWLLDGAAGSAIVPGDQAAWDGAIARFLDESPQEATSTSRQTLLAKGLDLDTVAHRIVDLYGAVLASRRP